MGGGHPAGLKVRGEVLHRVAGQGGGGEESGKIMCQEIRYLFCSELYIQRRSLGGNSMYVCVRKYGIYFVCFRGDMSVFFTLPNGQF